MFTDEKDFMLEIARNPQNDRVYGARRKKSLQIAFIMNFSALQKSSLLPLMSAEMV